MTGSRLDSGVASVPLPGQAECGDMALVQDFEDGTLVAAVDGIGHGAEAANAARIAVAALERDARDPVISLVFRCHEALRGTRGVVMSLASYNERHGLLTWIGIGNVAGVLLRRTPASGVTHESLLLRAGVVGSQLPPLQASMIPVAKGDTLVFATDGVRSDFMTSVLLGGPARTGAERILREFGKGTDDGLAVVVRI